MTIKTKASLQSFFQRGDRPTSAQFADLINTFINIPVAGSTISTGLLEVVGTASTTSHTLGTFANTFLGINTTAQAQAFLAFTSASGAGGGAFGADWLNANTTSEAVELLGDNFAFQVLSSAGDMLYTDGSGLQRLDAAAASGYAMRYNKGSDVPYWADVPPTLVSAGADSVSTKTAANFSIPPATRRFTVCINGISTNGTSQILIRLGGNAGIQQSGYVAAMSNTADIVSETTGIPFGNGSATIASNVYYGAVTFTLMSSQTHTWVAAGVGNTSNNSGSISGFKSLAEAIQTVQVVMANGTDVFDAGSINVVYD